MRAFFIFLLFLTTSCTSLSPYHPDRLKSAMNKAKWTASAQFESIIDTLYTREMNAFEWPDHVLTDSCNYRDSIVFRNTAVLIGEWLITASKRGQF